jgi:hypothetical protein
MLQGRIARNLLWGGFRGKNRPKKGRDDGRDEGCGLAT